MIKGNFKSLLAMRFDSWSRWRAVSPLFVWVWPYFSAEIFTRDYMCNSTVSLPFSPPSLYISLYVALDKLFGFF